MRISDLSSDVCSSDLKVGRSCWRIVPWLGRAVAQPGQGSGACDEAPHAVLRPLMEREQCHVTRIRLSNNEYSTTSAPLRGAAALCRPFGRARSAPPKQKARRLSAPGFSFGLSVRTSVVAGKGGY